MRIKPLFKPCSKSSTGQRFIIPGSTRRRGRFIRLSSASGNRNDSRRRNAGGMWSWSCATSSMFGKPMNRCRLEPSSSKMWDEQLKVICRKLKPILGGQADSLWLAYVTAETPQSKLEAEAFIQLFGVRYLSRVVDDRQILLPPPS